MKTKYDFSFFKKVPWRMAHPDAPKAYDGYYTIVPRKHRFVMNERMQRIQDACERRVHALVREDSLRRKRQGKSARHPQLYRNVLVRTMTRTYLADRTDARRLVREERKVEKFRLLKADYDAFPLDFALALHRADGDGLSLPRAEDGE